MEAMSKIFRLQLSLVLLYHTVLSSTLPEASDTTSPWTHSLQLGSKQEFQVHWKSYDAGNGKLKWLEMEVFAPTKGFVGIGFTQHSGMDGADIVIGWVSSTGQVFLKDFHGEGNAQPVLDPDHLQSYKLISGGETDSGTTLRFRRLWDTCDDEYDAMITNDTMRLIWAYGTEDPRMVGHKLLFSRHEWANRGVRSVFIQDKGVILPFPDDPIRGQLEPQYWDFRMENNTIDADETVYFCKIVKIPVTSKKTQMIGMRPLLVPENKELVHHIGLYECVVPTEDGGTDAVFERHLSHPGGRCYTASMPAEWGRYCHTFLITWAAGSEGDMFPEHIGNPIGEEHNGATYFMMEMHYNNPERRAFVDSSGVRVFYTERPRLFDSSTMLIGHRFTPFHVIPPEQRSFRSYGLCSPECTEKTFPSSGINVVSVLLHGHLAARSIRLRHFRNGIELPVISQDQRYDYNYQQTRFFPKEVKVLPGDELISECDYNTENRTGFTLGGLTATDEMCLGIILYYPRIELDDCRSQPELQSFFRPIGVESVEGKILEAMHLPYDPTTWSEEDKKEDRLDDSFSLEDDKTGKTGNFMSALKIIAPQHLQNQTVDHYIKSLNWKDDKLSKAVQDGWRFGKHYAFCTGHGRRRIHLDKFEVNLPHESDTDDPVTYGNKKSRSCPSLPPAETFPSNDQAVHPEDLETRYPAGGYQLTNVINSADFMKVSNVFVITATLGLQLVIAPH